MSIYRDITTTAELYLEKPEIMLFIGARQSGKTTILKQLESILQKDNQITFFLNLEDPEFLSLLNQSPRNLLKIFTFDLNSKTFVFIDEIQYLKNPTNFLKFFYDEYQNKIKLIVSGSSAFHLDGKFHDSLAGRKKIFPVRTLSFREFLRFKNENDLFQQDFFKLSLTDEEKIKNYYGEYVIYGGYPKVVLSALMEKKEQLQEIGYSYIKKDIFESGVRQEEIYYRLLKLVAGSSGGMVNFSELASTLGVGIATVQRYFHVLQKSFHISLIRPFYKNVRKEITKMPKAYFYDLGLRNFFAGNFDSFISRADKGSLLETAVYRQLLENYDESEIKFWRTIAHNEVDFVVENKRAFEVKFNTAQFKKEKYRVFLDAYPGIDLRVVAYEIFKSPRSERGELYPWQVS